MPHRRRKSFRQRVDAAVERFLRDAARALQRWLGAGQQQRVPARMRKPVQGRRR